MQQFEAKFEVELTSGETVKDASFSDLASAIALNQVKAFDVIDSHQKVVMRIPVSIHDEYRDSLHVVVDAAFHATLESKWDGTIENCVELSPEEAERAFVCKYAFAYTQSGHWVKEKVEYPVLALVPLKIEVRKNGFFGYSRFPMSREELLELKQQVEEMSSLKTLKAEARATFTEEQKQALLELWGVDIGF